ncbi:cell wall hydrolase [uncultured Cohaesibacter sp.]|uniref:cell wall hydrolase n=1 Tax=uncultured Cohaesibacter sp. TaxID=1002546 RepID=UPI003748A0A2
MSKSLLGQKSLGLTTCLMIGTALVLSFTQSLDEDRSAAVSLADLRKQGWTAETYEQAFMPRQGAASQQPARASASGSSEPPLPVQTASFAPAGTGDSAPSGQFRKGTYIQISEPLDKAPDIRSQQSYEVARLSDLEPTLTVDAGRKGDRRRSWTWEPFKVAHGRRDIALNWSGSVWHMASPVAEESNEALPKLTFEPADDLTMVMADAQHFLKSDGFTDGPDMMYAQNGTDTGTTEAVDPTVTGSTALAYAPTSDSTEAPFEAILTEQRKGAISEDNQVTVIDAIDDYNSTGDDGSTKATGNGATQLASLPPINALPRVRVPYSSASVEVAQPLPKVSKPLDISPIVADAEPHAAEETESTQQAAQEKAVPLTLARSQARRAELKLAKLADTDEEEPTKKKSRWASWFNFSSPKKAKIDARGEHAWVTNKLPKSSYTSKQKTCLANAIYFESRSEPETGQIAVAQVVMNRVKNPAYPDSICGVVYQNQNMRNACQFSFACDGIPDRVRSKKAWDLAVKLANEVINEEVWLKDVGSATHYHATYVRPKWAKTMKKADKIGLHIFYKTYGGGWS